MTYASDDDKDSVDNIYYSSDEFDSNSGSHAVLTSRLRRKRVSRSKGGLFRDKKKKKRLYINAYSSEIDIQSLLGSISSLNEKWYSSCFSDVLYLSLTTRHKSGTGSVSAPEPAFDYNSQEVFIFEFGAVIAWGFSLRSVNLKNILKLIRKSASKEPSLTIVEDEMGYVISSGGPSAASLARHSSSLLQQPSEQQHYIEQRQTDEKQVQIQPEHLKWYPILPQQQPSAPAPPAPTPSTRSRTHRHRQIRHHNTNATSNSDFHKEVSISDEVITLCKHSTVNTRLSVSYAVAQSIIVSAFEDTVANKIEEYRYIPTVLASEGQIKLR